MIRDLRKSTILYMALAALLTACSNSEQDETSWEEHPLVFKLVGWEACQDKASTRASLFGMYDDMQYWGKNYGISITSILPNESNAVYFTDKLSYFGDIGIDEYGNDNGYWDTTDKYYWPPQPLTFYGLIPYTDPHRSVSADLTTITYTSPEDNSGQFDMMYAYAKDVAAYQTIDMNFKHALAAITFSAHTKDRSVSVTVKGIKVCKVKTSGTFTLPTKTTLTDAALATAEDRADRIGTWSNVGTLGNLSAGIIETELTTDDENVTASDGAITIIPQELSAWDKNGEANDQSKSFLVISCKLISAGLFFAGSESSFGDVYVPFDGSFKAGKCYNISLVFGLGYTSLGTENKINVEINSTITDWASETLYFDEKIL